MTEVVRTEKGKGILFSISGWSSPRQPVSSAMPTKGIMTIKRSGSMYHAVPLGLPNKIAYMRVNRQNPPVIRMVFPLFSVYMILLNNCFTLILSLIREMINTAIKGVGVENSRPMITYST